MDDIPPRILSTAPESNATRVSRATRLSFTFSEPLNRKSFEDAIFITPNPARSEDDAELQFKWRGKTVDVILPDSLREQRTYVVTVGTGVRDRRGV
ncbi:Ig-like domain-containing protein, partial [candidate division KSB1 bacterium]|nr:Ig-like domain-containing protein [candidate division KSB1 bacterium]